jgi:hypothetical protein
LACSAGLPVRRGAAVAVKAANNELDTEDINKKLNETFTNTTSYLQVSLAPTTITLCNASYLQQDQQQLLHETGSCDTKQM